MASKVCTVCSVEKDEEGFYWRKKDVLRRADCKECVKAKQREWNASNREIISARNKKYRQKSVEAARQRDRESYARRRESILSKKRDSYRNNSEMYKERQRVWRAENLDQLRVRNQRRRAREASAEGSYTKEEWDALVLLSGGRCFACGIYDPRLTVDHIVPISKGGSNYIDNIQPLCSSCNCKKGATATDYRFSLH